MMVTYEMLYKAWKDTVTQNSEESNRVTFKHNLEDNLYIILHELKHGTYNPSPLRLKKIYYPKERIAQVPSIKDKIVQHCVCDNYAYEALTKPLIKESSACLKGRGDEHAEKILKENLHKYYRKNGCKFYCVKLDIHNFFGSIPHDRLVKLIDRYVLDEDCKKIILKCLNIMPVGIPLGLQQSQLLANLYLSEMDHIIKEKLRVEYYGRYMDDFYIISKDYGYARMCFDYIERYVQSIGLELNPKSAIICNKVDFLGFSYHLTKTGKVIMRINKKKRNSKHRQIKKMLNEFDKGNITADEFAQSYSGWRAHALRGNCKKMVDKWDDWIRGEFERRNVTLNISKRRVWV